MTLVLGHRGAPRRALENTIESFALALSCGADGVELDVRLTVDHALALRHDDGFSDGTGISTRTLAEARELESAIPLLEAALDTLRAAVCVVEMKTQPGRNERFADLIAQTLRPRGQRLVVSSFDPTLLRGVRDRLPGLRTALLVGLLAGEQQLEATVAEAVDAGHGELHVHHRILTGALGEPLFAAAAASGLDVIAWTVNDVDEAADLRARGLAGIITDVPDQMVDAGLQA